MQQDVTHLHRGIHLEQVEQAELLEQLADDDARRDSVRRLELLGHLQGFTAVLFAQ